MLALCTALAACGDSEPASTRPQSGSISNALQKGMTEQQVSDVSNRLPDRIIMSTCGTETPKPFACKFSVDLEQLKKPLPITIVADRLFRFRYTNDERHNFCLEQDRGTMTVGTKRTPMIGKSSFRKKQIGYFHLWKQGLHKEQWGFARFRVLTITTAEARIETMLEAQREVTNDTTHGLFLYSTPERIAEHGVLGPAWISAERDDVSLLDTRKE